MRYWIKAALFAAGLAFSAGMAFAQDAAPSEGPLAAKLTVERVVFDEESKKETLVAAETAAPGDLLQYKGTYTNISEVPLAGLVVKGPIPSNTVFSEGGLSVSAKATLEVLIEGEPWQTLPAYKTVKQPDGKEERVVASPSDYKELRWKIWEALEPKETLVTIYRVKVEQ